MDSGSRTGLTIIFTVNSIVNRASLKEELKNPFSFTPGKEQESMMDELCRLIDEGKFCAPPCTVYPCTEGQFQKALDKSMEAYVGAKQLLRMKE